MKIFYFSFVRPGLFGDPGVIPAEGKTIENSFANIGVELK